MQVPQSMTDTRINIPTELVQFVERDTYSLLIKGRAGTGKTTLALTILHALNIKENFQYLSTRISPTQLHQYYPWLGEFFGNPREFQTADTSENGQDAPIFVDARLDEPSSMFERITNHLMDMRSPMIIIDSWDAVGYFMDKEALMNNARVLQTWRERAKAKMIFISEEPENNTFDVLVDGIVELRQRHQDNRLVRELFLSKLRGVQINRSSYLYTLNGTMFHSFEPYSPSEFTVPAKANLKQTSKNTPLLQGRFLKSGNSRFDEAIGGGFPLKSTATINLNHNVNNKVALRFLSQIISGFTSAGSTVLCQCSEDEADYLTRYSKVVSQDSQGENMVFVGSKNAKKGKKQASLSEMAKKLKAKNPGKLLISVIFLESNSETDIKKYPICKQDNDLTIVVTNSETIPQEIMSKNSDVSIRFLEINGTLLMQSEIPWSHIYATSVDNNPANPQITFEPII